MKCCVLFGAGAELCFSLSGGEDFSKTVLGVDCKNMNEAIRKYYSKERLSKWYPKYNSAGIDENKLIEASLRKMYLEKGEKSPDKRKNKKIKEIIGEYSRGIKKKELLNNYSSYMGVLDEKFHTIIAPTYFGPVNFWKVVSCYMRAYLLLVSQIIYENPGKRTLHEYENILKDPVETYKKVCESCEKRKSEVSYYEVLSNHKENITGIITTNYTPYAEIISGVENSKVAYLHGRIGWFESAENLKIYDVTDGQDLIPENETVFPFILIQSGTKPIIGIRQMREYSKMLDILDESEKMIVVGYAFNYDDNHILGFVRNYLDSGKKVCYLHFGGEKRKNVENLKNIYKERFEVIDVDDNNSVEEFEKQIE